MQEEKQGLLLHLLPSAAFLLDFVCIQQTCWPARLDMPHVGRMLALQRRRWSQLLTQCLFEGTDANNWPERNLVL